MSSIAVFGYSAAGLPAIVRNRFAHLSELLGKRSKLDVSLFESSSYEELARAVSSGYVDVAWLAPLPFIELSRRGKVVPLVHLHRVGGSTYRAVIVVRSDAPYRTIGDLRGARAAWVERNSASGFVVPRALFPAYGVDPRTDFSDERFCKSHAAVIRALMLRLSDFGATYANVAQDGTIARGPWLEVALPHVEGSVRVLAILAEVPGDVVVARAGLEPDVRERFLTTLLGISRDRKSRLLASDALGVDQFEPFAPGGYAELEHLAQTAADQGLLRLDRAPDATGTFAPIK